MLQTKQKNKKHSATGTGSNNIKKFLWIGLRRALFCFCMLILALSMLTVYTMYQEITIKAMQYLAFGLCGIDFLLCGILSAKHPQASPIKDGLYATILILLFLFLACLLASNGHFENKIYLLPLIAILCCVFGILFGLKINIKSRKAL